MPGPVFRSVIAGGERFTYGLGFAPLLVQPLLEDLQHHIGAVNDSRAVFVHRLKSLLYSIVNSPFVSVGALVQTKFHRISDLTY